MQKRKCVFTARVYCGFSDRVYTLMDNTLCWYTSCRHNIHIASRALLCTEYTWCWHRCTGYPDVMWRRRARAVVWRRTTSTRIADVVRQAVVRVRRAVVVVSKRTSTDRGRPSKRARSTAASPRAAGRRTPSDSFARCCCGWPVRQSRRRARRPTRRGVTSPRSDTSRLALRAARMHRNRRRPLPSRSSILRITWAALYNYSLHLLADWTAHVKSYNIGQYWAVHGAANFQKKNALHSCYVGVICIEHTSIVCSKRIDYSNIINEFKMIKSRKKCIENELHLFKILIFKYRARKKSGFVWKNSRYSFYR